MPIFEVRAANSLVETKMASAKVWFLEYVDIVHR
jgi:hypothetical protein